MSLIRRLSLVLGQCTKYWQFTDIIVSLNIANQKVLLILNIVINFNNFASVDIIEINEDCILVDCKHEIASEGLERNESTLTILPLW